MSAENFRDDSTISAAPLNARLAKHLAAAAGLGALAASDAQAVIISNTTPQPFGINGEVNIDLNSDSQIDIQIDHDRYNLSGNNIDYLQFDKNDVSSAANPLPIDVFATFPLNGTPANGDLQYLAFSNSFGDQEGYPVALKAGDMVGTLGSGGGKGLVDGTRFDFQEGDNYNNSGTTIRANRLIDEDRGQIDTALQPSEPLTLPYGPQPEFPNIDDFIGLAGATRYVGFRIDLNDALFPTVNNADNANQFRHGWIGIQITNESDATGLVTGWAYETTPGMAIAAGDAGPPPAGVLGDYNGDMTVNAADYTKWRDGGPIMNEGATPGVIDAADYTFWVSRFGQTISAPVSAVVPEPTSLAAAALGGGTLLAGAVWRKFFGR